MKKNKKQADIQKEKDLSFVEKMKTDKKYSAKVQLIGYGVFVVVLIIYLNLSSMGSNTMQGNNVINNVSGNEGSSENTEQVSASDKSSLLEKVNDNYYYDMVIDIKRKNID